MQIPKIFESEMKFCQILWENEPVSSSDLVKLCREKLDWKKSTTYTVIKRLSERGVLKTENTIVTSLVSRDQVQTAESHAFVNQLFDGSLPSFFAAFTGGKGISSAEAEKLRKMIDEFEEKHHE